MALLLIVFVSILSYSSGAVPFAVVGSDSMEPALERGDLIYLDHAAPAEVETGNIIAFHVPRGKQKQYGYPPQVIHRVREVKHYDVGLYFETGGIATRKDPFRTSASDLTGVYGGVRIPYLGFVFLFLQTTHGQIYVAIVVVSLSLYTALPRWLEKRREKEERVEKALESSKQTRGDIASFSNAMAEYAQHLRSHTAAVQELAETTKELREVVSELDRSVNSGASSEEEKEGENS
ncbi:hypothetical protein AKJ57_01420 [candidate division MSBL1 archaeon SCGC-AAA259A05]|uniref:Signal peptidase I n=1 Tax=candidate division MSBL1 archaeon SCGC-AAA259A05 TaxID=1698259 RepID=A0A133UB39_9EURY|nr:hypothetical protein AKJ57_01420 [candidate division MSBL1 archaeon SCGC-AAA259A05]